MASSMVRIAGSGSRSKRASFAALRAAFIGGGRDGEHRLAGEQHDAVGEDRIVVLDRADVVDAGNVGGGDHGDDARRGPHGVEVERPDPAVRDRTLAHGERTACRAAPECRRCTCGSPATCRCAESWAQRSTDDRFVGAEPARVAARHPVRSSRRGGSHAGSSNTRVGRARAAAIGSGFMPEAVDERRQHLAAIVGRRAHVGDRRELGRERRPRRAARSRWSQRWPASSVSVALARTGVRGDTAAADARRTMRSPDEIESEADEHRGDVLIEAPAHLVGAQQRWPSRRTIARFGTRIATTNSPGAHAVCR